MGKGKFLGRGGERGGGEGGATGLNGTGGKVQLNKTTTILRFTRGDPTLITMGGGQGGKD